MPESSEPGTEHSAHAYCVDCDWYATPETHDDVMEATEDHTEANLHHLARIGASEEIVSKARDRANDHLRAGTDRIGAAEKMLPTEGNAPDYVVAVGDELATGVDQGGDADGAYSEGEVYLGGKCHRVMVRYSINGMSGISIAKPDTPDEWISYEPADEQPDTGTLWLPPFDYLPEIRTLPETAVDEVLDR